MYSHFRYSKVKVVDFGRSWRDGRAFGVLLNRLQPNVIDGKALLPGKNKQNLEHVFKVANEKFGIPRLLDAEGISF